MDRDRIETIAHTHGFHDLRWISGKDVEVRQWVRFKCMFGCGSYGRRACCPPAVPPVAECRELFSDYGNILIVQIAAQVDPDDLAQWSRKTNLALMPLEREVFLAGYPKALLLFMDECRLCDDCPPARAECRQPSMARPCPEALGVDVFTTARRAGFQIDVVIDFNHQMKKFAFLLVD